MKWIFSLLALSACSLLLLAGCGQPTKPAAKAPEEEPAVKEEKPEKTDKIAAALAKLSPEDRKLAEEQKYCALENKSLLGTMGPPVKIELEGQTVFLCCKGCEKGAKANPEETLAKVEKLKAENK